MTAEHRRPKIRALVIGGSLGGLFAANVLKKLGWDVDVYERSPHELDSRGGGIVLQPDVVELIRSVGIDVTTNIDLGVRSRNRTVFRSDGTILSKRFAPQTQTSWSLIYIMMKRAFGEGHYHRGKKLTEVRQGDSSQVAARFDDGSEVVGDLLIGADGNGSTVRQLLWPDAKPTYAGYVAWRGLVPELEMPVSARDGLLRDFGFSNNRGSHILGYIVPGENNDTREGHRLYNWVWYRVTGEDQLRNIMTDKNGKFRGFSVPQGSLADQCRDALYQASADLLPPPFHEVVTATKEPFVQAIRDLTVDTMVKGRVILTGDAAFVPRPHTAASTSKAAANALALAEALEAFPNDLDKALQRWEPQQLALGERLYQQGTNTGNYLLFHRTPGSGLG